MADLNTAVTTAFSTLETNVTAIGVTIVGIACVIGAVMLFKRFAKSVG